MSDAEGPIPNAAVATVDLRSAPIKPENVIAGAPEASKLVLWISPDGRYESGVWACTPGSFNLDGMDETVCLVEGVVEVTPRDGDTVTLRAGDTAFFPAGLPCRWEVKETIRKAYSLAVPAS